MRVRTYTALFVTTAILLIIAVAAEVVIDDYVKPHTLFAYLVISTLLSGAASLALSVDIPQ